MSFIPASAFNEALSHQLWVHDGVANARRSRRIRQSRRRARDAARLRDEFVRVRHDDGAHDRRLASPQPAGRA
jgi:hypothetical protein